MLLLLKWTNTLTEADLSSECRVHLVHQQLRPSTELKRHLHLAVNCQVDSQKSDQREDSGTAINILFSAAL